MSVSRLDDDEKLLQTLLVSGQNREIWTVSESGLYSLILRSNKLGAKRFKKWVTGTVLPTIRKTGTYSVDVPKTLPEALRAYALEIEKSEALNQKLIEAKPKIEFFEAVADSKDAIDMGTAAKVLNCGIGRNDLFQLLRDKKILMEGNVPYQTYVDREYFRTIEQKYTMPDGSTRISIKTLVYQKGLEFIRKIVIDNQGE
jgi:phage antirepressor YoqD-like protein